METRPFGRTGERFSILSFGAQRIVDGHHCSEADGHSDGQLRPGPRDPLLRYGLGVFRRGNRRSGWARWPSIGDRRCGSPPRPGAAPAQEAMAQLEESLSSAPNGPRGRVADAQHLEHGGAGQADRAGRSAGGGRPGPGAGEGPIHQHERTPESAGAGGGAAPIPLRQHAGGAFGAGSLHPELCGRVPAGRQCQGDRRHRHEGHGAGEARALLRARAAVQPGPAGQHDHRRHGVHGSTEEESGRGGELHAARRRGEAGVLQGDHPPGHAAGHEMESDRIFENPVAWEKR